MWVAAADQSFPFDHNGESLGRVRVWNLLTDGGYLDISFVPTGTQGYPDLVEAATEETIYGIVVQVASLDDIIRSKTAADRPKDREALPSLLYLRERRDRPPLN